MLLNGKSSEFYHIFLTKILHLMSYLSSYSINLRVLITFWVFTKSFSKSDADARFFLSGTSEIPLKLPSFFSKKWPKGWKWGKKWFIYRVCREKLRAGRIKIGRSCWNRIWPCPFPQFVRFGRFDGYRFPWSGENQSWWRQKCRGNQYHTPPHSINFRL